jgi:hypothetical protein
METTGVGGDAGRAARVAANSSGVRYLSELWRVLHVKQPWKIATVNTFLGFANS